MRWRGRVGSGGWRCARRGMRGWSCERRAAQLALARGGFSGLVARGRFGHALGGRASERLRLPLWLADLGPFAVTKRVGEKQGLDFAGRDTLGHLSLVGHIFGARALGVDDDSAAAPAARPVMQSPGPMRVRVSL